MKLWANTLWQSLQRLQPHGQPQLATEPLNLGTIVSGRFQITAVLGEGGFGRTYRAKHLNRFGQDVAIKEFAPDRRYVKDLVKAQELFEREAQVLFKLDHPQIPKFLENVIDRQGGSDRFFIVQEFISGKSYHFILQTQYPSGFPVAEVRQLLIHLLPVLDYLHQQRPVIIHRDISPDNILRCNLTGLPKLVDFGAVKMALQSVTKNPRHTIVGKPGYAPPEQQLGKGELNATSDLYSLGVTAIVLLTGQPPEKLQGLYGIWHWRDHFNQLIDDRFAQVLDRMVLPSQYDRFQSAREVLDALQGNATATLHNSPNPSLATEVPEPEPLVYSDPTPTRKTKKTIVVAPLNPIDSTLPPYRSLSSIPDPIIEFFKAFLTPEFCRFAQRQVLWVSGLTIVVITPFFIANAIDRWQDRPRLETPETPEETSSPENVQTVSECDRFNAEYVERQIDQSHPYLMLDIDDAFYEKYPELEGQPLDPGDPKMEDWCAIGNEFLAESQD